MQDAPVLRTLPAKTKLAREWRMKITERTRDHLVVRHVPWFLGGFMAVMGVVSLYAAAFKPDSFNSLAEHILVACLGLGVLAGAWWFAPVITLYFDRAQGRIWFRETRLLRPSVRVFDLSNVERVQLQSNWSDGSRLHRIVLRTADGVTPLETGYTSADRTAVMQAINEWLAGETPAPDHQPTIRRRT